jgi:hypothetical protein
LKVPAKKSCMEESCVWVGSKFVSVMSST